MKPKQKKALITLLVIFGIAMLGNILLTLYYLNFLKQDFHFFLAIGLLVAQPCILSIWCALGGQRAVVRKTGVHGNVGAAVHCLHGHPRFEWGTW